MPKPFNPELYVTGKMPFGPHKGKPLDSLSALHLAPLVTHVNPRRFPELFRYLNQHRERLMQEYSELKAQQDFFSRDSE